MAWPLTARYEPAVAGNTVKAALLNAIQDAIYRVVGGIRTVKSLHADGTGDNATGAAAGVVKASGYLICTTTGGSGGTPVDGAIYQDNVVCANADVAANGTIAAAEFNIDTGASTHVGGSGVYAIVLKTQPAKCKAQVTLTAATGFAYAVYGAGTITVYTFNVDGITAADKAFYLTAVRG